MIACPSSADTDMGYHPPTVREGPVGSRRVLNIPDNLVILTEKDSVYMNRGTN